MAAYCSPQKDGRKFAKFNSRPEMGQRDDLDDFRCSFCRPQEVENGNGVWKHHREIHDPRFVVL